MNQVAKSDVPQMATVPLTEAAALIHMIERLARDPSVDLERLERLIALRERTEQRQAEQAFAEAMSQAQSEMRAVAADSSNPQTRSRYASYFALDKALRPIYTRHGFALSFDTEDGAQPDYVCVVCFVSCGGLTRKYHVDMPADGKGAKGGDVMTKTHAVGSAVSYASRYLLKMIFNVAIGESDDDGNAAGDDRALIAQEQADSISDLLESTGKDRAKFLKWAKIEKIEDLRAEFFDSAIAAIKGSAQ